MVNTEPGFAGNPTYKGLRSRLDKEYSLENGLTNDDTAWATWLASQDPVTHLYQFTWRIVIVPVIEDTVDATTGRKAVEVAGMAGFFIESISLQRGPDRDDVVITGRFIQGVVVGDQLSFMEPNGEADDPQPTISVRLIS